MKKSYIIIGAIVLFIIIIVSYANSTYNTAIKYQEEVGEEWGNVQTVYQRRADLVPQLVATVKGAAENEKEILTRVTEARAGIVRAKTPGDMEMLGKEINTAINLAFEAYPQIRSTANFSELQAQLEGTENRIAVARKNYNQAVKLYNVQIRGKFKKMALAWFGEEDEFMKKEAFTAISEGAEIAPTVEF